MFRERASNEHGISLLEIMIALTILSTVLLSLSGLMWQMGRHTRVSGAVTVRTATLESAATLAESVTWDSLLAIVGCTADTTAQLEYTLCYEVQNVSPQLWEVRVIIAPTVPATLLSDTLTIRRAKPKQASTLNGP